MEMSGGPGDESRWDAWDGVSTNEEAFTGIRGMGVVDSIVAGCTDDDFDSTGEVVGRNEIGERLINPLEPGIVDVSTSERLKGIIEEIEE